MAHLPAPETSTPITLDHHRCRNYAAERWANAVYATVNSPEDPRTFHQWGRLVGASRTTVANWCRATGVSPRRSLELARLLRALVLTDGNLASLQQVLDIIEPRTIVRMKQRAGLRADRHQMLSSDFLATQTLVKHTVAIDRLASLLQRHQRTADSLPPQRL